MAKAAIPPDLPIHQALPEVLAALALAPNAVLVAPPGAGKTTSVPLALLDAEWRGAGKIIMLAPRHLAARSAAARMASLLGEAVGDTVGYRVRLDSKISPRTRIEVVTEGVFTRMILDDPELTGVAAVIFDEVHERNLEGDLALALALDSQSGLRGDLRLLAMSATLDGSRVAELMGSAPIIESAGRMFPVTTHYVSASPQDRLEIQAANVSLRALGEASGDILVFLPGVGEINRAFTHLETKARSGVEIAILHGGLEPAEQDAALRPVKADHRKIILSTAIAETSLTIAGVGIVVDCGLSRRAAYEPDTGLTRLVTVRASRASADQRRGRAGRTGPGVCYRLWEEAQTGAFPAFDRPEILEADLAPMALTLAAWGVSDPQALAWLDPPPVPAWREAVALLQNLNGLDEVGRITAHGRDLLSFGLSPRLAHMIVRAAALGFGTTAAYVAALLSERGLGGNGVDLALRLEGLKRDQSLRGTKAKSQALSWAKQAGAREAIDTNKAGPALALAYPERVAKARDRHGGFILRGGRGGEMPAEEVIAKAPFLAIGGLQGKASGARISEAAALSRADIETLFGDDIEQVVSSQFDKSTGRVQARRLTRLGSILLEQTPAHLDTEALQQGLYDAVLQHGLSILNWTPAAILLRDRLAWLHARNPVEWQDVSDSALLASASDWLLPALAGVASLGDCDVEMALKSQLDWGLQQKLEAQAPRHFLTPAETRHVIDYAPEQGPTVEVRVQEVFGLSVHPMLAGGHVPLVFQLLSPAHRPIAVTSNLPAFWRGAWADVRKEMKARYPRHVWPDDPMTAPPTTRAKPRGT
jgi:ATP-dependent helicase HrpB